MNYITKLQSEVAAQQRQADAYLNGITDLQVYLTSDKFASDPTVQVADVMTRLREIVTASFVAKDQN